MERLQAPQIAIWLACVIIQAMSESILALPLNTEGFYSLEGCKRWNIPMAKDRATGKRYVKKDDTKCEVRSTPYYEPKYFIRYTQSGRIQ